MLFIVSIKNFSWVTDILGWNCKANFIGVHLVFQINFSKKNDFSVNYFITVVQRTVVKQQHLHCSRIASAPAVSVNFCNFDFKSARFPRTNFDRKTVNSFFTFTVTLQEIQSVFLLSTYVYCKIVF